MFWSSNTLKLYINSENIGCGQVVGDHWVDFPNIFETMIPIFFLKARRLP